MTNSIRQTTACDIAGIRRRVGGTVVTYWVLHGTETTRDRVVAEFDRYGIAVGAGGDWTVTNAGGGVVVESASDRPVVESLQGTSDADIEAYVARIVAVLAGQQSAEDIAGIGHVLLDKLEATRAEVERLQGERDRLADDDRASRAIEAAAAAPGDWVVDALRDRLDAVRVENERLAAGLDRLRAENAKLRQAVALLQKSNGLLASALAEGEVAR